MCELDCEEGWAPKNWYFWSVVLEKTLESPLDCKEIQPIHYEGDQSWVFIGRTDAEAETPILWPPHAKSWLIGENFNAGRDWGQEEKGTTEDEMAGWHHWLDGRNSEWTPGVGDGQGGLACCDSWGRKESNTTERLNWTELLVNMNTLMILKHSTQNIAQSKYLNIANSLLFPDDNSRILSALSLLNTKQLIYKEQATAWQHELSNTFLKLLPPKINETSQRN